MNKMNGLRAYLWPCVRAMKELQRKKKLLRFNFLARTGLAYKDPIFTTGYNTKRIVSDKVF
jgi:hypothetical protein